MSFKRAITILVLIAAFASALAGPEYFSADDAASYKSFLTAQQNTKTGAFNEKIADTHWAVEAFVYLNAEVPNAKAVCQYAESFLEKDVESIYHAVSVMSALKCSKKASTETTRALVSGLAQDSITDKTQAVLAINRLGNNIKVDSDKLFAAFKDIRDLADSDGTFKLTEKKSQGSAYYAGLAYQAFAKLYPVLVEKKEGKDKLAGVVAALPQLVEDAEDNGEMSHTDSSISNARTTAAVLKGVAALSKAMGSEFKGKVSDLILSKIARYVLSIKETTEPETAHAVLVALNTLNGGSFKKPQIVSVLQSTLQAGAKKEEGHVKVRVTDVFGKDAPANRVFLSKAYAVGSAGAPLASNQPLEGEKGVFSLNFLGAKPEPGHYHLEFTVSPADEKTWIATKSVVRPVKVVASAEVTDGEFIIANSRDSEDAAEKHSLVAGKRVSSKGDIVIGSDKHIFISFRLKNKVSNKPLTVQQAFVTFSTEGQAEDVFYVVPVETGKKLYKLQIDVSKMAVRSGKAYTLRILIGDPVIDNSLEWEVATVKFTGKAATQQESVLAKKPEIHHKFREPEKRPPAPVSQAFTLVALAPLGLLIIGFLAVGINFGNLPGGLGPIYALGFFASLAAGIYVYLQYWLEWTLFEFGKYITIVAVPLCFFGHRTLRAVAVQRQKAQ